MRRFLRWFFGLILLIGLVGLGLAAYLFYRIEQAGEYRPPAWAEARLPAPEPPPANGWPSPALRAYTFHLDSFAQPPADCHPWTRWWWPGSDVDPAQLRREVRWLKENGFAGAEVQAFSCGIDKKSPAQVKDRVFAANTPGYFANLRAMLDEAVAQGLQIDLNAGSGWPSGGPHIGPADNMKTLVFGETLLEGGQTHAVALPEPQKPFVYRAFGFAEVALGGPIMDYLPAHRELVALLAAQPAGGEAPQPWRRLDLTRQLRPGSVVDLTAQARNGQLTWTAPPGQWALVAIYAMPEGENPTLAAQSPPGLVVDHFDTAKIQAHYDALFGRQTGLAPYFGRPIRAFFNDSFEFKTDRHFATGLLGEFQRRRGYDLRPLLPEVLVPGRDNFYFDLWSFKRRPAFSFGAFSEQVNYDYSLTVSDLIIERFLGTSNDWAARRGLLSRTQAYGMWLDVIKAAGHTHLPEAEQLYAGGTEMFLKLVASGAHLYGRPLVSAEAVVYQNRDHLTTPQKIKLSADKLFVSGINHFIYHGTPYGYPPDSATAQQYGDQGWHPFSSPFVAATFSSDISARSPFAAYFKPLNTYMARAQYVLRQGQPEVDVLVYYPFLGFTGSFWYAQNHQEFLFDGQMPGIEPPRPAQDGLRAGLHRFIAPEENPQVAWLAQVWPLLQTLENQGITWAWANDESLATAARTANGFQVRGRSFRGVLLPHVPSIQLATARHLQTLAQQGLPVLVQGQPPSQQPGYANLAANNAGIRQTFASLALLPSVKSAQTPAQLAQLVAQGWGQPELRFAAPQPHLRQARRRLPNGDLLVFVSNRAATPQAVGTQLAGAYRYAHWLDPWTGEAHPADLAQGKVTVSLPAYGSLVLYAHYAPLPGATLARPLPAPAQTLLQTLDHWRLKVESPQLPGGQLTIADTTLFDWRRHPQLRWEAAPGHYSTTFILPEVPPGQKLELVLEQVYFAAEVRVNGQPAGSLAVQPFRLEVAPWAKKGKNTLEIKVIPARRNYYVGQSEAGRPAYQQFKGKANTLLPAGLVGRAYLFTAPAR
jgi:hypothetical protein